MIHQDESDGSVRGPFLEANLVGDYASFDVAHTVSHVLGDVPIFILCALSPVIVASGAFSGWTVRARKPKPGATGVEQKFHGLVLRTKV